MRCLSCRAPGEWFCSTCEQEHERLRLEVRAMTRYLGDNYHEGRLILTASQILESAERVENTTSLGKAAWMARANELLAEVEDHFRFTPTCPGCRKHKMELIPGDPIGATCTGGCELT